MRSRPLTVFVLFLVFTNLVPATMADEDVNHKPTARITTPQNNTQFDGSQKVTFIAEVFDKDGDDVTVVWSCEGNEMERYLIRNGTGLHQWSTKLKAGGTYTFELMLSDGKLEKRYYLTIVIRPGDDPYVHGPMFSFLDAVVAGSIAFGIILAIFFSFILRRDSGPVY